MYGSIAGYGYLPRYMGPHPSFYGRIIGRHHPTRWEEFAFIVDSLDSIPRPLTVLDAGCGFNPEVHVLPIILGVTCATVIGVDANPAVLDMPPHPNVTWTHGDLTALDLPDASVDYYCSISVFEHLSHESLHAGLAEARRVVKPGGFLLATVDWTPPAWLASTMRLYGFDAGQEVATTGEHLSPTVAWCRAMRVTP